MACICGHFLTLSLLYKRVIKWFTIPAFRLWVQLPPDQIYSTTSLLKSHIIKFFKFYFCAYYTACELWQFLPFSYICTHVICFVIFVPNWLHRILIYLEFNNYINSFYIIYFFKLYIYNCLIYFWVELASNLSQMLASSFTNEVGCNFCFLCVAGSVMINCLSSRTKLSGFHPSTTID